MWFVHVLFCLNAPFAGLVEELLRCNKYRTLESLVVSWNEQSELWQHGYQSCRWSKPEEAGKLCCLKPWVWIWRVEPYLGMFTWSHSFAFFCLWSECITMCSCVCSALWNMKHVHCRGEVHHAESGLFFFPSESVCGPEEGLLMLQYWSIFYN